MVYSRSTVPSIVLLARMVLIDDDGWQDCCVRSLVSCCEFCSWQSAAGSFSSCVELPASLRRSSQCVAFVIGTFQTHKSLGICIWRTCFTNCVDLWSDLDVLGKVFVNASVVSSSRFSSLSYGTPIDNFIGGSSICRVERLRHFASDACLHHPAPCV